MNALRFAWRALWRDFKSGELAILAAALIVAVAAVATVGLFTDRVQRAMERQAGDILAADLVLQSRSEPDASYIEEAQARGLEYSTRWSFASVILAGDASVLANVRAVGEGYPLRGTVQLSDTPFGVREAVTDIPEPGTVWLDARLFAQLNIVPGDEVDIGARRFTAAKVLEFMPDEGFGFTDLAPALLMNLADVPDTDLVTVGSRVGYRLLFAGETDAVDDFGAWLNERRQRNERVLDAREERPELGRALDRAGRFLGLAAIVSVLLAAIAVATAARRYASRHLDGIAILKCLGGSQRFVVAAYALQLAMIGLAGAVIGVVVGWVAQEALIDLMAGLLTLDDLPSARPQAALASAAVGIVVLVGFALPPLLPLRNVPPARVLRHELAPPPLSAWVTWSTAVGTVFALLLLQTRDAELTLWAAVGAAVAVVGLASGAALLLWLLSGLRGRVGVAWRYGLANIVRRRRESVAQIVAFGLGIMMLLLLGIVRNDLMSGWQEMLTEDAPNQFLINIQSDQHDALARVFQDAGLEPPQLFAMVRGRMTHLDGVPVDEVELVDERARWFVERDANLSWAADLQADNRIVAGEWWTVAEHGQPLLSLEQERAERMGIGVGDTLTYDIAGESITLTITSLRSVDWDSFNPNFFLVLPPGALDGLPATWVGATHVAREDRAVMIELMRTLPTVTVIDIDAVLGQVRRVVAQASRAVEFVFLFTLLAGITVMLAAINASRDERLEESAMLRTFGARRGVVLRGLAAEFITLGALAGLLAAAAAGATGWVLAREVFEFEYGGSAWAWLVGLGGGGLGIGLIGLLATRSVLNRSPLIVLRRT